MQNLYLVRHGETEHNKRKIFGGTALDLPLNEQGREDALYLAQTFHSISLDAILTSPATRAIDSIRPLATEHGLVPIIDANLVERDHGQLNGTSYEGLGDVIQFLYQHGENYGDEPLRHVRERSFQVLKRLFFEYHKKDVLIMSHGFFLSDLCNVLEGKPIEYAQEYVLHNRHFHHYQLDETGRVVQARLNLEGLSPLPSQTI